MYEAQWDDIFRYDDRDKDKFIEFLRNWAEYVKTSDPELCVILLEAVVHLTAYKFKPTPK